MVKSNLTTGVFDFGTKKSNPRKGKVCCLTPHHTAGPASPTYYAKMHYNSQYDQSANYYIRDDEIIIGVSEDRRAWTSASPANDHRAITFEVSNNKTGSKNSGKGWTVSDKSYKTLVKLCADICKRYGFTPHYDGTKNGTITMHKQFQATGCPGEMLESLIVSHQFENDILAEMGKATPTPTPAPTGVVYRVQIGAFKTKAAADRYAAEFTAKGKYTVQVVKEGAYYKVKHPSVGFTSKKDAEASRGALVNMGYKGAFVTAGGA